MKSMKAMKSMKGKEMKAMKGMKANKEKITYVLWEKRMHWHAWNNANTKCDKDGVSGAEKRERASKAGREENAKCRKLRDEGNLPAHVQAP